MWKQSENSNEIKPNEIDETSSKSVVYIRRDFKEVDTLDNEGNKIGTHWKYEENTVPKKDWDTYKQLITAQDDITSLQLAICELYERSMNV